MHDGLTHWQAAMLLKEIAETATKRADSLTKFQGRSPRILEDGELDDTLEEIQRIFKILETNNLEPEKQEH